MWRLKNFQERSQDELVTVVVENVCGAAVLEGGCGGVKLNVKKILAADGKFKFMAEWWPFPRRSVEICPGGGAENKNLQAILVKICSEDLEDLGRSAADLGGKWWQDLFSRLCSWCCGGECLECTAVTVGLPAAAAQVLRIRAESLR